MKAVAKHNSWIVFGIPCSLFMALVVLIHITTDTITMSMLDVAITLDLVLIVPLVYFLLIRKTNIPKTTVIPVMILGMLIGYYFLPSENQFHLDLFKSWALPFIEFGVLVYIIIKVRTTIIKYKNIKGKNPDFYTTLKETCYDLLPRSAAMPFAAEIAVFYYGFVKWKTPTMEKNTFSYHKKSGTTAILIAFIFLILVETVVVHIVLQKWSFIAAWILTGLSIYSILQIWGFTKSIRLRPISVDDTHLSLKYGIHSEAQVSLSKIDNIELSRKAPPKNDLTRNLSPLGDLESHNVIIHLNDEAEIVGLYGSKKKFNILKLYVDDPTQFQSTVLDAIVNPDNYVLQREEIIKKGTPRTLASDRARAMKAIAWIFGISWIFGFLAFYVFRDKESVAFGVSVLIFSLLPALTTIVINKSEGGRWKELNFKKIERKDAVIAFLTPIIYFSVILSLQYFLNIRSLPDWEKIGTKELLLSLVFGYPIMMFLIMGEEIAWRGYLQEKLIKSFGGLNGLVFLGFIWGIWHLPLSLQGHNFPNNPMIETWITTPLMCIALAIVIGYYGINKKSILIGIILHASNNHFGGTFLYLTDTYSEIQHAVSFCVLYIIMILVFGYLYVKKDKNVV